jgi:hypothetical protein
MPTQTNEGIIMVGKQFYISALGGIKLITKLNLVWIN